MSETARPSSYSPIGNLRPQKRVRALLTDIDDTLTDNGRLSSRAYEGLWRLADAGIAVVPITGRPAGWCDLIVRQWPVAGIVGENGAFTMHLAEGRRKIQYHPAARPNAQSLLNDLREKVLGEIPEARIASDQPFRLFDLAIDFAEDEPNLGLDTARKIHEICVGAGAEAKISSIHVNAWFGSYSKLDMSLRFLQNKLGIPESDILSTVVFVGDSPNDEPMFAHFPFSVAVANIDEFRHLLESPPSFVTDSNGGVGFCEVVNHLLSERAS